MGNVINKLDPLDLSGERRQAAQNKRDDEARARTEAKERLKAAADQKLATERSANADKARKAKAAASRTARRDRITAQRAAGVSTNTGSAPTTRGGVSIQ